MLRVYSLKPVAMLVLTMSFVTLAVAITVQPANAQASDKMAITAYEQARAYLSDGREFQIDTVGLGNNPGDSVLRITRFEPTAPGSPECPSATCHAAVFHGYYRGSNEARPTQENVYGTIIVNDIVSAGRSRRSIITRITFHVGPPVPANTVAGGGTDFEGAIRFARQGTVERTFMAGTFSFSNDGYVRTGPFPFSGIPLPLYR